MHLSDHTILITGGSSGIGLELARQFLALGNTVVITGRDEAKLERARAGAPGLHTVAADVADPRAIAPLFEAVTWNFPELSILVNNAGIMRKINLHEESPDADDLTREIETNLSGAIRLAAQFIPHLKTRETAAIVNVTSGLAFLPAPASPVYCAAKAALHSFTQSLRAQLRGTSVRVFELAPPLTRTPLADAFDPEEFRGIPVMSTVALARHAIRGLRRNRYEIRPGLSNVLYWLGRLAPGLALDRLGRASVERLLAPAGPSPEASVRR